MIVSPAEPAEMKVLGDVSSLCEKFGVDYMWSIPTVGIAGVQRKEFSDLISSLSDGRLVKELAQMKSLRIAALIIEGRPTWTIDGELMSRYVNFSRSSYDGIIWAIQAMGVWVHTSDRMEDTRRVITGLRDWSLKKSHWSMLRRPKPKGPWGTADDVDYLSHLLQSFPGWGPSTAHAVIAQFDGKIPLAWSCSLEDLESTPGVGPKRARAAFRALGQATSTNGTGE